MAAYDAKFFDYMTESAARSAARMVPLVVELLHPKSVIDVGCGTGAWVEAFVREGIEDVWGADGEWVDAAALLFPGDRFISADLTRPLTIGRTFDLVVSLEVAEHLPASAADAFVASLVNLGHVVLFSAAIPSQGGTRHINEQWPDYWAGRFAQHGYSAIDCIRPRVWDDPAVAWYYAQNTILYASSSALAANAALRTAAASTGGTPLRLVHPERFKREIYERQKLAQTARELNAAVDPGRPFILVDDEQLRALICAGAQAIPFTQHDGAYWGPPADDAAAIAELERLRAAGARRLVVAWPSFWWLEQYRGWQDYLRKNYRCICEGSLLIVFDLCSSPAAGILH